MVLKPPVRIDFLSFLDDNYLQNSKLRGAERYIQLAANADDATDDLRIYKFEANWRCKWTLQWSKPQGHPTSTWGAVTILVAGNSEGRITSSSKFEFKSRPTGRHSGIQIFFINDPIPRATYGAIGRWIWPRFHEETSTKLIFKWRQLPKPELGGEIPKRVKRWEQNGKIQLPTSEPLSHSSKRTKRSLIRRFESQRWPKCPAVNAGKGEFTTKVGAPNTNWKVQRDYQKGQEPYRRYK